MSVRKDKKTNKWLVDISTKNLITRKRRRIVRKNFSTKQEAIEVENTLRATLRPTKRKKGKLSCNATVHV